jgi:hypothetical protein
LGINDNTKRQFSIQVDSGDFWNIFIGSRSTQNIVFPEGLVLDTEKRRYLTSRVNGLFLLKEKLPIKNDEESSLVAGAGLEPAAFGL